MAGCPGGDEGDDGSTSGATDGTEGPTMSGPPTPSTSSGSPTTNDPSETTSTGMDDPTMDSTPGESTTSTGGDEFPPLTSSSSGTGTGSGSGTAETAADCSAGASDTAVSGNHGHAASIDAGMLIPATPINNLDIQGDADHPHTISLTGTDVDNLLAGMAVTVTSSFDGHSHSVTLSC
jgi:hypothetical protein